MKQRLIGMFILCIILMACSNEKYNIQKFIDDFESSLNTNNIEDLGKYYKDPSLLSLASTMMDINIKNGIIAQYSIEILSTELNGSIAEVRTITSIDYSKSTNENIGALLLFMPKNIKSLLTLQKTNNNWKIIREENLD